MLWPYTYAYSKTPYARTPPEDEHLCGSEFDSKVKASERVSLYFAQSNMSLRDIHGVSRCDIRMRDHKIACYSKFEIQHRT